MHLGIHVVTDLALVELQPQQLMLLNLRPLQNNPVPKQSSTKVQEATPWISMKLHQIERHELPQCVQGWVIKILIIKITIYIKIFFKKNLIFLIEIKKKSRGFVF